MSDDETLRRFERARAKGDMAAHAAIKAWRERKGLPSEAPEVLVGYDWDQAFAAAGIEEGHISADIRPAREASVPLTPFERRDIKTLVGYAEGENDGPNWLALGELWDGRWFFLSAGCDYTGWDCQAGGVVTVALSYDGLDVHKDDLERLVPPIQWPGKAPS